MTLKMTVRCESWPLAEPFVISRGAKSVADVVVVELRDGAWRGRGEAVPYARYGETSEQVCETLRQLSAEIPDRSSLATVLRAGAARNALDCALWDLAARRAGRGVADLAGLTAPKSLTTAYTLSLATPSQMAAKAQAAAQYPLLKLKLGAPGDGERMAAVRAARPDARLIIDANEAWPSDQLGPLLCAAASAQIELIEQPLPAGQDQMLAKIKTHVPICADESAHVSADLAALKGRYDAVNIKLDKTGGLTEALEMMQVAASMGLKTMVGCMVSTSLAMAPACLIAQSADWVDLDGPLLLARDREPGLMYDGALIHPPSPELWG